MKPLETAGQSTPEMPMFTAPPWLEPRAAYLHIPFCGHQCGYCDFAVTAGQDHLIDAYLEALELELRTLGEPRPVETIFVGGGTPTYLSVAQLSRFVEAVQRWLPLVPTGEFTMESTPESLDEAKVDRLAEGRVTRISIGVQSFRRESLAALDRRHGVEHITRAVSVVRQRIAQVSLDLIFASPGQSLADWRDDLATALSFSPEHLSTYGLTYEKGTRLWKHRRAGAVVPVTEEVELEMYQSAMDTLTAAGFEHYEISNFARPGRRCRHNERYWANHAYHGFGVGAARYVNGTRELNVRETQTYIRKLFSEESPTFQSETLSARERAVETMVTQLRRADGICRSDFTVQTGYRFDDLIGDGISELVAAQLLRDDGQTVRLTRAGRCVADGIVERMLTVAQRAA